MLEAQLKFYKSFLKKSSENPQYKGRYYLSEKMPSHRSDTHFTLSKNNS